MLLYFLLVVMLLVLIYLMIKIILNQQKSFGNKEKLFLLFVMDLLLQVYFIYFRNKYSIFISVNVKDENGKSIFAGRKATSYGNQEEEQTKTTDDIPFLVETCLKELGANYQRNEKLWGVYVTVDGQRTFVSSFILFIFYFFSYSWSKSSICS